MANRFPALHITRAYKASQFAAPYGPTVLLDIMTQGDVHFLRSPLVESVSRTPQAHIFIMAPGGGVCFLGLYCAGVTPGAASGTNFYGPARAGHT